MSKRANSHRKRQRGWALRRLAALAFTLAGLAVGSILAPTLRASSNGITPPPMNQTELTPSASELILDEVDIALDLSTPTDARTPRRRTRSGVPLSAAAHAAHEGYEILSATELDGISQARN